MRQFVKRRPTSILYAKRLNFKYQGWIEERLALLNGEKIFRKLRKYAKQDNKAKLELKR